MGDISAFMHVVAPDGWVEGAAAIIISVLSWYLGRKREAKKQRERSRGR
jgi:hypothetical protein